MPEPRDVLQDQVRQVCEGPLAIIGEQHSAARIVRHVLKHFEVPEGAAARRLAADELAMLAEANKSPLDVVEAESELISGYNTEYSGVKFALFYAGEYAHTLALCGLAATVFFGGYLGPAFLPGPMWLVLKSLVLFVFVLWIRWSFLRVRIDQVLRLNWHFLFPVALANLLVAAFFAVRMR